MQQQILHYKYGMRNYYYSILDAYGIVHNVQTSKHQPDKLKENKTYEERERETGREKERK